MVKYKLMLQSGCCKVNVPMEPTCDARAETPAKSATAKSTREKILRWQARWRGAREWKSEAAATAPETLGCAAIFWLRLKQSGAS